MSRLRLTKITTPSAPPINATELYYDNALGCLVYIDSAGVVHQLLSMAAGLLAARYAYASIALTDGATPALDASQGNIFLLSAAGDRTIAVPTNPIAGQNIIIRHYASGGSRTLSLNTGTGGFRFGSDITALTATPSGKTDYIGCQYNATSNTWDVLAYVKGF
jgi:hypothetical protein